MSKVKTNANSAYPEKTNKSAILIIGNGFDLQCELKSKYSDFFNWCKENESGFNALCEAKDNNFGGNSVIQTAFESNHNLTIWDLYFIYKSNITTDKWCDVENEINNSIQSGFWDIVLQEINYFQMHGEWKITEDRIFFWVMNKKYYYNENWLLIKRKFPRGAIKIIQISSEDFYEKLLNELKIFENRFAEYINEELDEKTNIYYEKQTKLINKIIKKTTESNDLKIISFNYTPLTPPFKVLNIHGELNSPIFGISANNNKNKFAKKFTKSARRRNLELPIIGDFINNANNYLIFYGVSFNNLDHDYYELLINHFCNGKIYFCYSSYDNLNKQEAKEEQENKAEELINKLLSNQFNILREKGDVRFIYITPIK